MNKLQSLRDAIAGHFTWLAENPQAMMVFATGGGFGATLSEPGEAMHIGYNYTGRIILTEFAGDLREVTAVIWDWIRNHQPDIAQNAERRALVRFDAELLDNKSADVQIDIPLTEHASFVAREGGGFIVTDGPEPVHDAAYAPAGWTADLDLEPFNGSANG